MVNKMSLGILLFGVWFILNAAYGLFIYCTNFDGWVIYDFSAVLRYITLIILAISICRLKEWSRKGIIYYHIFFAAVSLVAVIFDTYNMDKELFFKVFAEYGIGTIMKIVPSLAVIYFFTRPKVKEQFKIDAQAISLVRSKFLSKFNICAGLLGILYILPYIAYFYGLQKLTQRAHKEEISWISKNQQNSYASEIARLKETIAKDSPNVENYSQLSMYYDLSKQSQEAILWAEKAIKLDNKYVVAYNQLGLLYAGAGRTEEAITILKKAIEINPKNADSFFCLGTVYEDRGNKKEAMQNYRKSKEASLEQGDLQKMREADEGLRRLE